MKLFALLLTATGLLTIASFTLAEDDTGKDTIKNIMKKCMNDEEQNLNDGLCKKVATGKATQEEKDQLVAMLTALTKLEPPKGETPSWQQKTGALLAAAKSVIAGDKGAGVKLANAADCKGCHSAHRVK